MLNKKLVLAALLGAAVAQEDPPVEDPATVEDPAEPAEPADPADPADPVEPAEPAEEEGEEEDERLSRDWKETIPAFGDVAASEVVKCDQGESALWEDAKKKLVGLAQAKIDAQADFDAATSAYDDAKGELDAAQDLLDAFEAEVSGYTDARDAAQAEVTRLAGLVSPVSPSSADFEESDSAYSSAKAATAAAEAKVTAQVERIEMLIAAERTQDQEEATWEERKLASEAAQVGLDKLVTAATAHTAVMSGQLDTRSYLFQLAGAGLWHGIANSATKWDTGCGFAYGEKQYAADNANTQYFTCTYAEDVSAVTADADVSTWGWAPCYPDSAQYAARGNLTGELCQNLGLKDDPSTAGTATDGLIAHVQGILGSDSTPDGLYLAFQNANYEYHATPGQEPLSLALASHLAWQQKLILSEMLKIGQWTAATAGASLVASADLDTNAAVDVTTFGSAKYSWLPYLQGTDFQAAQFAAANTARKAFDDWDSATGAWASPAGTPALILPTQQVAAATALTDIWYAKWAEDALNQELAYIGDKGAVDAATWEAYTVAGGQGGLYRAAEIAEATAVANAAANTKNTNAMARWKELAAAESAAVNADRQKAKALLTALTEDIAPIAMAEAALKTEYDAILAAEALKASNEKLLGNEAQAASQDGQTPATEADGARGVLVAAEVAVASAAEQRKYHEGRRDFYKQKADPLGMGDDTTVGILAIVTDAKNAADAAYDAGLAKLNMLRDQCKSEAYGFAQKALAEATAKADLVQTQIADTLREYTDLTSFPEAPAVGALCNYPKDSGDATPKRPDCGEDNCCGAAQRFMKDGTKLSIETCQLPTTTTYTYYPALPANALVAPAAETWRFQCISAAGRVAASVAAALATGYMLA